MIEWLVGLHDCMIGCTLGIVIHGLSRYREDWMGG